MIIEAMKQALEKATEVMEAACIRVDELKAENESLRQAIAEAEKQDHIRDATKMVEQEPVAWFREEDDEKIYYATKAWNDCQPLYTHPQPKREWVGLTDEELKDIWVGFDTDIDALKAVEAKLKEKNT